MTEQEIENLLKKYHQGRCTPEEELQLYHLYNQLDIENADFRLVADLEEVKKRTLERLQGRMLSESVRSRRSTWYWGAAAAIIVLVGMGITRYALRSVPAPVPVEDIYAYNKLHDVQPGISKAMLTLANGDQITLDDVDTGMIALQGGMMVRKGANGQLIYVISSEARNLLNSTDKRSLQSRDDVTNAANAYNTITVPKGGQYELILPDGSHVWLNAASSLRYPVRFNGMHRSVELTGEAYFEITKQPHKPFRVISNKQIVEVLGTHFNVASYSDEPVVTTLVEGKVKVTASASSLRGTKQSSAEIVSEAAQPRNDGIVLKPGQQAILASVERHAEGGVGKYHVERVNTDNYTAWKDGLFIFDNTSIKDVLRQISRWYDIDVDYNSLPEKRFNGEISRDFPLSELLKAIEKTNHIKLKIEGRKITIVK
jgi:ferric-dicitrate binding protein FerR (iron transport regulator)